ncbi:hypothetical protein [Parenemella sanctibonifatiensis]|uniref:Lipoprotein n=1 Tax=Parenemella sanctibonifatiensis TaxID=2016505 RepID=A0A255EMB2_9ACTN|nr:hypothetical protein [Parenemella sanctibonifatiensis]OYN92121.1 hypothetical protein CGZ91_00970 [Parenemella sanctibonifatiensis]
MFSKHRTGPAAFLAGILLVVVAMTGCGNTQQAAPGDTPDPSESTPGALPSGATQVWLHGDQRWPGPAEPLTTDVQSAIDAFNELPSAPPNQVCTMEYRLAYEAVFDYPDGRQITVAGELHGCRTVRLGAAGDPNADRRLGGEGYLNELLRLWQAQGTPVETP